MVRILAVEQNTHVKIKRAWDAAVASLHSQIRPKLRRYEDSDCAEESTTVDKASAWRIVNFLR